MHEDDLAEMLQLFEDDERGAARVSYNRPREHIGRGAAEGRTMHEY